MPKGDHRRAPARVVEQARQQLAQGDTQERVAQALGVQRSTIGDWCRRFGWPTQRTGPRSGPKHTGWKGGRRLLGRYWHCYRPAHPHANKQRCVAEHRLVMEETLGRYLLRSEVVHHIDRNPQNNAPENLMVFSTNGEHLRHELKGQVPQWSPEGRDRIRQASAKGASILRRTKSDGPALTPSTDRPTS